MMARKSWFLQLLTLTSSIPIASSSIAGLGSDITSLVPPCAQTCLLSYLPSNYPTTACGTDFTLPCLCSTQSTSGFTVGEVALQCLLAGIRLGQCSEQDLDAAASQRVYGMCQGQKSALPNTHPTLTATLFVPSSGGPSLLPPAPPSPTLITHSSTTTTSQKTHSTSTATSTPTTLKTTAIPSSSVTSSPSAIVPSETVSPSSLTTTTTSVAGPPPFSTPTSQPSSQKRLAPGQVAGISVGVISVVGLALGAIFLAKFLRRRKNDKSDSEKAFFQNDNSTATLDHIGPRTPGIFHISPPVFRTSKYRPSFGPRPAPPSLLQGGAQTEAPASPANIDRNTIGLAISRPRSWLPKSFSQPQSPAMSSPAPVEMPAERRTSRLLPPRPTLTLEIPPKPATPDALSSQQKPPTTDRVSTMTNMTAFADLDTAAVEGGQVWRPPPTDPLSANTLYCADKYGNWVLRNDSNRSQGAQAAEECEPSPCTPFTKSPTEMQEETKNTGATFDDILASEPQPASKSRRPISWKNTIASSLYSQPSAVPQTGNRGSSGSNLAARSRRSNSGPVVGRSGSKDSVTTIQTSSTGDDYMAGYVNDIARLSQLTPVQESPTPASRRPKISYPKIPGRLDGATIRFVPPPKRPNFENLSNEEAGPSQRAVSPALDSPSPYPPPLNPRRGMRRHTESQVGRSGLTPEPPNVEVFPIQNYSRATETPRLNPRPFPGAHQSHIYGLPSQQVRRKPVPRSFAEKRLLTPSQPSDSDVELQGSSNGSGSANSSTSSLLAKRLGNEKAATLTLTPNKPKPQKWQRQGDGGRTLSPDVTSAGSSKGTLPQTPGWQPRLTPTRRGDDLFLDVQ